MTITFSSAGCKSAADDLINTKNELDVLLNQQLTELMENVEKEYQSESSEQVFDAFKKLKEKFPDFIASVNDCATYLKETVVPAYEKLEQKVSQSVN